MNKNQIKWNDAVLTIQQSIRDLLNIQNEYQEKFDEMSERQQGSDKGAVFQEICDLDFDSIEQTINDAESIELP